MSAAAFLTSKSKPSDAEIDAAMSEISVAVAPINAFVLQSIVPRARIECAVDCRIAINPDTIAARVDGRNTVRPDRGASWQHHAEERVSRTE